MTRVNEFLSGTGTDAPDVEEENIFARPSGGYDDMWAKTLLEPTEVEEDDVKSSGSSSPESMGSSGTAMSSSFGGMNYPSLFSSQSADKSSNKFPTGGGYEAYSSPNDEFVNPLAGPGSSSFGSRDEEQASPETVRFGTALYDFTAGGDDELNLTAGEELEIEYEVDGWFYVKKKRPGRDGKMAGLVPVLYVNQS